MRTPKPTVVYIVSEVTPENVYFQKDIADKVALKTPGTRVFAHEVITAAQFNKGERADLLATLTDDQRKTLGLGPKKTRKKKDATMVAPQAV